MNRRERIDLPTIVHAPVGSDKTTFLQMGAAQQPHTLLCTTRSRGEDPDYLTIRDRDVEPFVDTFTASLGLLPRPSWITFIIGSMSKVLQLGMHLL